MRIFSKTMPLVLGLALLASSAFATNIYDRDFVRGFISLKGDRRWMNSNGQEFINRATYIRYSYIEDAGNGIIYMSDVQTGNSYAKDYSSGHVEIGAQYNQLRTWFDIDFMPRSLTRKYILLDDDGNPASYDDSGRPTQNTSRWYSYGIVWMWGYELFRPTAIINIIPSMGAGFELLNVRYSEYNRVLSFIGPALNLEMELRLQISRFSLGAYGGYKIVRHDGWDAVSKTADLERPFPNPYQGDVNADKAFVGVKLSWTMLSDVQKRLMDLE